MRIRRKIVLFLLLLVCFIVQGTFLKVIAIGSISPNLILIFVVSFGFMRGKKEGIFVGFFAGLLLDIMFGTVIGFYALIYMYIGYLNGFFKRIFFSGCGIFTCLVTRIHIFPLVAEIVVSASSSVTFTDTSGIEK